MWRLLRPRPALPADQWPSVVSSSRGFSLRRRRPVAPPSGRLSPRARRSEPEEVAGERDRGIRTLRVGREVSGAQAQPAGVRARSPPRRTIVRAARGARGRPGAVATTSQVSQVWPNSPACRTRWRRPGSRQVWVTLGLAVRRPADRRGSPWSPRPDPITVRRRPASTGRANTQARAVAPSSPRPRAADLVHHVRPLARHVVLPRRRCRTTRRSPACRRARPTTAASGTEPAELDPRHLHRHVFRLAIGVGVGAAFRSAGARPRQQHRSAPRRPVAGTPATPKGDGPTIPACAQP